MKKKEQKKTNPKKMMGKVVSTAMQNTLVVQVGRLVTHSLYKKKVLIVKKYKVHCEDDSYQVGDRVQFQETAPISKEKRWIVVPQQK